MNPAASFKSFVFAASIILLHGTVVADPISLFNTGVTSTGSLASANSVDQHYTLLSSTNPNFTGPARIEFNLPGGYPVDGPVSQWIGPVGDANIDGDKGEGTYVYRTTFDLTGLNPSGAQITGQWATDNYGTDILINGISTGSIITSSTFDFHFVNFAITSGFLPGINTLDFVTYNQGGPMGLRVEMSGEAASAVPLPAPAISTLVLFGTALILQRRFRPCRAV